MWSFQPVDPGSFRAPARKVTRVFLHCTDSDAEHLQGVGLAEEVNRWHLANGWAGIGYHFIVDKLGVVVTGRPLELQPSAQLGPDGMGNVATIAISLHGSKHWTMEGFVAVRTLCHAIDLAYGAGTVSFHGHCEIDPRPCPVYPYQRLLGLDAHGVFGGGVWGDMPSLLAAANGGTDTAWPKLAIVDAPAHPIGQRVLFEGCHGPDVTALQISLGRDVVALDGWFGRKTFDAVVAFQRAHGLQADGVVGDKTRAALGLT